MKKFILASVMFLASVSQAYVYFQNPTYCRADWTCDIVSTDFNVAADVCSKEVFANQVATVYQKVNGKMALKGYGCFDNLYTGGE